jgi:uncharacterized membrane protein YfcA
MDPRIVAMGLGVGLLVGLSGVGGSSLMTPLLILVLGVNPLAAIGTDLAYSAPTKLLGALIHWQQRTVDWRLVRLLALGGVPGALLGLAVLAFVQATLGLATLETDLQRAVGIALLVAAAALVLAPLVARARRVPRLAPSPALLRWKVVVLGALVGVCVSLTSIGAGAITMPALYALRARADLRQLVGSDVCFAALLVPIALLGHAQLGTINFALSGTLLVGSLPGVFIGSRLCAFLPERWLRPALAVTLVAVSSRLL